MNKEQTTAEVSETRKQARFVFARPVPATFGPFSVRILNVSSTGLHLEHADPLRLQTPLRLSITLPGSNDTLQLKGKAVWSRLSRTPDQHGKYLYRSGLRFEDQGPAVAATVDRLITVFSGEEDPYSLERKKAAIRDKIGSRERPSGSVPLSHREIAEEQRVLIIETRERLQQKPEEAAALSQRARTAILQRSEGFSVSDESLAVWEYLERHIPLDVVSQVLGRLKTR